jgi:hypothetical protein
VAFWNVLVKTYEYSNLKKFNDLLSKGFKTAASSSHIINFCRKESIVLKESLLYRTYSKAINGINNIFKTIRKNIIKYSPNSFLYTQIKSLFYDDNRCLLSFYLFFMAFGIGLIVNNLIRGFYFGRSYIVAIFLIIISLIGINIRKNQNSAFKESVFIKIIVSIFTVDEEVEQWW